MKEKLKNTKGITLIALIITIIVLLILAMVSIKLVWDGGIITHAQTATSKYTVEQEKELIGLGYSDYKMAKINDSSATLTVEGAGVNGINPWTIIFNKTGNEYTLAENGKIDGPRIKTEDDLAMEKYVLGEELKGQDLSNICNWIGDNADWSFPNQLNGESVEFLNWAPYCYTENNEEVCDYAIYIKYKNKAYRILGKFEYIEGENGSDGTRKITTKGVNMVYEPKGDEGNTVEYSIDGTEANKKQWTILYDDGTNYEIISPDSLGNLTLGYNDTETTGNNDFEKSVNSYNNAIERINKYASDLVTNPNKLRVRSVGSNPKDPNSRNTDKYTSEKIENWNCHHSINTGTQIPVTINGVGERSDQNFEQDFVRMNFWPGVAGTGEEYWLASRFVLSDSIYLQFFVNEVTSTGSIYIEIDQLVFASAYRRYF